MFWYLSQKVFGGRIHMEVQFHVEICMTFVLLSWGVDSWIWETYIVKAWNSSQQNVIRSYSSNYDEPSYTCCILKPHMNSNIKSSILKS
jgi:hypothetical protein